MREPLIGAHMVTVILTFFFAQCPYQEVLLIGSGIKESDGGRSVVFRQQAVYRRAGCFKRSPRFMRYIHAAAKRGVHNRRTPYSGGVSLSAGKQQGTVQHMFRDGILSEKGHAVRSDAMGVPIVAEKPQSQGYIFKVCGPVAAVSGVKNAHGNTAIKAFFQQVRRRGCLFCFQGKTKHGGIRRNAAAWQPQIEPLAGCLPVGDPAQEGITGLCRFNSRNFRRGAFHRRTGFCFRLPEVGAESFGFFQGKDTVFVQVGVRVPLKQLFQARMRFRSRVGRCGEQRQQDGCRQRQAVSIVGNNMVSSPGLVDPCHFIASHQPVKEAHVTVF